MRGWLHRKLGSSCRPGQDDVCLESLQAIEQAESGAAQSLPCRIGRV